MKYSKNRIEKDDSQYLAETVDSILSGKEIDREKLITILSENKYSGEFLTNLSSAEYHSDTLKMLDKAFEERDCNGLISELKGIRERRQMMKKIAIWTTSAVAVCVALVFVIYKPSPKFDNHEINKISFGDKIKTPTLFYSDVSVELDTLSDKLVIDKYLEKTKVVNTMADNMMLPQSKRQINRLVIPKGYIRKIILQDSTEVTLNSNSELKFPNSFDSESSRVVTLSGEAYFNVKKSDKLFIVNVNSVNVKVYGTGFNVNGRKSDVVSVVLVKGSVGLESTGIEEFKITPNQMAVVNLNDNSSSVELVNPNDYLGWCNGLFKYTDTPFNTVIADLSMWYNVDFNYDREKYSDRKITMSLYRTSEIDDILMLIETAIEVKFIKENSLEYSIMDE